MVFDRSNGIYRSIFAALVGWLILVGNTQPVSNDTGGNPAAAQRNQDTAKNTNVAAGVSRIGDALEAQNAKSDPYEKERNEREIRDLQAQEKSAYWAEAMFWATTAALILSVIGIGLVWTTFRETRKANEIARDSANFEHRPWIALSLELMGPLTFKGSFIKIPVMVEAKNVGNSAATGIHIDACPHVTSRGQSAKDYYLEHIEKFGPRMENGLVLVPNESTRKTFTLEIHIDDFTDTHHGPVPIVLVSVIYKSPISTDLVAQSGRGYVFDRRMNGRLVGLVHRVKTRNLADVEVYDAYGCGYAT